MAYRSFILDDFSGGLKYNTSNNIINFNEGSKYDNVISMPKNYIRPRRGTLKKNSAVAGATGGITGAYINGAYEFSTATTNHLLATSCNTSGTGGYNETATGGASIMTFSGSTKLFTNITASDTTFTPGVSDFPDFESFGGYCVITNGKDYPLVWEGTDDYCKQFSNTAATGNNYGVTGTYFKAKFVKAFKDYLFFAYTTEEDGLYRSRLRWCDPGDMSQWTSTNYLDIDADDGDFITGIELLGNYLVVFKERKIAMVTYVGGELVFDYDIVVYDKGCISGRSIVPLFNDLIFLAHDNIYKFNGSDIIPLGDNIKDYITAINPSYRANVTAAVLEAESQVWISIPYLTATENDKVLVLNYENLLSAPCWFVFDLECVTLATYTKDDPLTLGDLILAFKYYDFKFGDRRLLASAPTLLSSDYSGNIYDNDEGYSDNGEAFTVQWESAYLDFSTSRDASSNLYRDPDLGRRNKRLTRVILWIKQQSDAEYDMTIRLYTDYDETNYESFTISVTDDDYSDSDLIEKPIDCSLQGREFKIGVYTDGLAEVWEVHKITFIYNVKGRTRRT